MLEDGKKRLLPQVMWLQAAAWVTLAVTKALWSPPAAAWATDSSASADSAGSADLDASVRAAAPPALLCWLTLRFLPGPGAELPEFLPRWPGVKPRSGGSGTLSGMAMQGANATKLF